MDQHSPATAHPQLSRGTLKRNIQGVEFTGEVAKQSSSDWSVWFVYSSRTQYNPNDQPIQQLLSTSTSQKARRSNMHFIIRDRLAAVVLIVAAALRTPHLLVSGATTTMGTHHHLLSERQANVGHHHVANLGENTAANKKSFHLRLLALEEEEMLTDFCSPGNNFCHKDAICALEAPSASSRGYSCTCKDGYYGDGYFSPCLWYDECANEYPCAPPEEGGYCTDRAPDAVILPTKYACGCRNGFTSGTQFAAEGRGPLSCDDVNECVSTRENGEPLHNCDSEHGTCTNTLGSFTCSCEESFIGDGKTCIEIPPVISDPRLDDPCYSCKDKASEVCGEVEKLCICAPGYFSPSGFGGACQSVDECSDDAKNDCDANAHCIELDGSFDCLCKPGYVGNGRTCSDENECGDETLFQCDPNSQCFNLVGTYRCQCIAGYEGDGKTCINLDECALGVDSCDSNAQCFDTDGSFTCACNAGYEGDGMACTDKNECLNLLDNDCAESGKICFNTVGSFGCRTPTPPTLQRQREPTIALIQLRSPLTTFSDSSSPQSRSLNWILSEYHVCSSGGLDGGDDDLLVLRFALAGNPLLQHKW